MQEGSPFECARAKCCNLIGNMCRHSDRFYSTLVAPLPPNTPSVDADSRRHGGRQYNTVLALTVQACGGSDSSVRKFACFAVGNAAFHSDALYAALVPSVPLLKTALLDADDKTRANAAGAIGNLCRNSGAVSGVLSAHAVVHELIVMAMRDPAVTCQVDAEPCYLL